MFSVMESVNWVCEEALGEHEWVLERRRRSAGGVGLRYRCSLWYTGIAVVKLYVEIFRIAKFHEVTNLAIEAAINVLHEGRDTPRTRLLDSIALVLDRLSDKDWDLDKEMIGWELGESPLRLLLCCLWKKFGTMISVKMMFVAFSLKDSDLGVFRRARTSIQGYQNFRGFKARHDRAACGWAKRDGSQNHSGMCRLWKTQPKLPRTHGRIPKTKASGKKSLEKYINGLNPQRKVSHMDYKL